MQLVSGFSKLNKKEKINWLISQLPDSNIKIEELTSFWHPDKKCQKVIDDFSENTISNFILPFSLAPNFLINNESYTIPMVIEESSVVAAASKAAKFWSQRGGFSARVLSTVKTGQVHFMYEGAFEKLKTFFSLNKEKLIEQTKSITKNMESRGGGLKDLRLIDKSSDLDNYYQLEASFETCDAMGANFINTVLECLGQNLRVLCDDPIEVVMCILSNYTPDCLVEASVSCPVSELGDIDGLEASLFAQKFKRAIDISKVDTKRAVTHNKGIFNGMDAVVIASGNDFRATSASAHAYASRDGKYRGLSDCFIENEIFHFSLRVPLSIGTIGGLTSLHPMAKMSLEILKKPNAKRLMEIVAVTGLAQNFGAIRSLVTTGIQKGHMKMHLLNILNQLNATEEQATQAKSFFNGKVISFSEVRNFLDRELH